MRLLDIFHDLRLLIASMLTSTASMLWSVVLLFIVIYLASVTLVGAAAAYVRENDNAGAEHIHGMYDSLSNAMYTLFLSITGGMDWVDAASPTWRFGAFYGGAFMSYILFCLLGILNMITSVFIEHSSNMIKHDRDFAVSEEMRSMEAAISDTMALFETLTERGAREITKENLQGILTNGRVIAHFASIGIEISDPAFITHALGGKVGGLVDIKNFVRGCFSLRGAAKQSDTLYIMLHLQKLEQGLEYMMRDISRNFKAFAPLVANAVSSASKVKVTL